MASTSWPFDTLKMRIILSYPASASNSPDELKARNMGRLFGIMVRSTFHCPFFQMHIFPSRLAAAISLPSYVISTSSTNDLEVSCTTCSPDDVSHTSIAELLRETSQRPSALMVRPLTAAPLPTNFC